MQTSNSRMGGHSEPGWPLLQLPGPAHQALVAQLPAPARRSLRLACKAACGLVDRWTVQLRLSDAQLREGGALVPQRFCNVARLMLNIACGDRLTHAELQQLVPWPSVTTAVIGGGSLGLPPCSLRIAAHFLASLPNVGHCRMERIVLCGAQEGQEGPSLAAVCQAATRLTSLAYASDFLYLNDQGLEALALVPVLTELDAQLTAPGDSGWTALERMRALTSLHIYSAEAAPPSAVDLRALTRLTQLEWDVAQNNPPLVAIVALPTCLVHLHLLDMPAGMLPALPCLASLVVANLEEQMAFEHEQLAELAVSCPALRSLEVRALSLSVACHAAPLPALTQLIVQQSFSSSVGAQLTDVTPRLQSLALHGAARSWSLASLAPLLGCTNLTDLDVATADWEQEHRAGLAMGRDEFALLAALPALNSLRLDVTREHVAGLGQLTQLKSLEWVWGWVVLCPWRTLQGAFTSTGAPACLHSAAISCKPGDEYDGRSAAHGGGACAAADAAVGWLARAPSLAQVRWAHSRRHAGSKMTAERLAVLAVSASIERIIIDVRGDFQAEQHTPALLDVERQLKPGLEVVALGKWGSTKRVF